MQILVVSSKYPPEYAGSGLRAHNTYKRLSKKYGIRFNVIASSITSNKSCSYFLEGAFVRIFANKSHEGMAFKDSDFFAQKLLKRILNKIYNWRDYWFEALPAFLFLMKNYRSYDILHVFGNVDVTSAAISFAKLTGKPVLIELVNLVDDPHPYEPALISLLFGKAFPKHSLLVCISESLRKICHRHGYGDGQIWCRPNPVDESKFYYEADRKRYRKTLPGFHDSDMILLHLAKFMPRKKQRFMVEVMSYLPEHFKLILAGPLIKSGPLFHRDQAYFEAILEMIRSRGLENRIQVIPEFIKKPERYIKACDVFVMPTVLEALGTPFIEALACGVPVVANDIPGVFDQWIQNGVNGYICQLNPKTWAEKIILATQLDADIMKKNSEEILRVAATAVIDQEYYQRMTSLVHRAKSQI